MIDEENSMEAIIKYHKSNLRLADDSWQQLARQMWDIPDSDKRPVEVNFGAIEYSNINEDLYFTVQLRLREYARTAPLVDNIPIANYAENLCLRPYRHENKAQLVTVLKEPLIITRKAYYVFAEYLIRNLPGQISEDGGKTWMTAKEYRTKHLDVTELSGDEICRRSLAEAGHTSLEEEPWDTPGVIWA